MAKAQASFDIVACDQNGQRRTVGGDPFAVSVRGAAVVFAKVMDNGNGSYTVGYKPSTSGAYSISITLHGVPMPGSPFALTVLLAQADPSRCVVRGEALSSVVARTPSSFEIEFVDAFGQISQAEELDVFVEPRPTLAEFNPFVPTEGIIWAVVAPNLSKPLIVRSSADLASAKVAELAPGSMVGIIEKQNGRAQVFFRPGSSRVGSSSLVRSPPRSRIGSPSGRKTPPPFSTPSRLTPGRNGSPGRSPRTALTNSSPGSSPGLGAEFTNPLGLGGGSPAAPPSSFSRPMSEFDPPTSHSSSGLRAPFTGAEAGEVGWVTAVKDGVETLVLRHIKLGASRRQRHIQLWSKQLASEATRKVVEHRTGLSKRTAEEHRAAKAGPSCAHELGADSRSIDSIGFSYGGVDPGTLHARGRLIKTHAAYFSVGRAGDYLLHIGIRNQSAPLPGSPYELNVRPGPAHPITTSLPMDEYGRVLPLRGIVGNPGYVLIAASDKIGNRCTFGGSPMDVATKSSKLKIKTFDNHDGTYGLQWLGEVSGKYELFVTLGDVHLKGSPCELTLQSATPKASKCQISGGGLSYAVAGEKVQVTVRCKDRFSNLTSQGASMSFGLAIARAEHAPKEGKKGKGGNKNGESEGKAKGKPGKDSESATKGASKLPSQDFEGKWSAEGEYEIKYIARLAGDCDLHMWCDVEGKGVRQKLPGSPFRLKVDAAKASARGSCAMGGEQLAADGLTAGEHLDLGIHFRDEFGNACAPPRYVYQRTRRPSHEEEGSPTNFGTRRGSFVSEGFLAMLITPKDEKIINDKMRKGDSLGMLNLNYELAAAGAYEAHFTVNGHHITGSPVCFRVKPSVPSGRLSTLHPPVGIPPVIGILYELRLVAEDKYTNKLDRGGASVQARALGPSASPATTVDYEDGTYGIRFTAAAVGEYRVEVRLDNVKIRGSPHLINFTEASAGQRRHLAASGNAVSDTPDPQQSPDAREHDQTPAPPIPPPDEERSLGESRSNPTSASKA